MRPNDDQRVTFGRLFPNDSSMTSRLRDPAFQRVLFRRINVVMLLAWRLGLGRLLNAAPAIIGRIMILSTTGRRSGLARRFPVTYALDDGSVYCLAGFGRATDWYRNVLAYPEVELWLPGGSYLGRAQPLRSDDHLDAIRSVLVASGFASRTFEGIDARRASDEELRALADRFPLVRITLTAAQGGRTPADLAWTWPAAAVAVALFRAAIIRSRPGR